MSVSVDIGVVSIEDMVRALRSVALDAPDSYQADTVPAPQAPPEAKPQTEPRSQLRQVAGIKVHIQKSGVKAFTAAFAFTVVVAISALVYGNKVFAPEMYADSGMMPAAEAHAQGFNYQVFDLNLNVRALRDAQLATMTKAPDVIIYGASQYQEAHADLLGGRTLYNMHIHRDYWEDLPGMVELMVRHDRLPKVLIVAIRDKQFTPVELRKDYLWEPGIPAYRAAAQRLGFEVQSWWKTAPWHRAQALISLPMFFENFTRWNNAPSLPGPTTLAQSETMDMLMPDGSINWSNRKLTQVFTRQRTINEVNAFANAALNNPPVIDPRGIEAWEATFKFLKSKGVQVYLTNPTFNPDFYDRIKGTPYEVGFDKILAQTNKFSKEFGFPIFGNANPHEVGCVAEEYIDSEHAHPSCMKKIFAQFLAAEKLAGAN